MPFDKARQAFMAADSGFQNPWAFDPNNASAGLDAGFLARMKAGGTGGRALDPNGQYMVTGAGDGSGAGNNYANGYTIMDKNGGAFWDYDPNGQFIHYRTKSMDDNWGALLPLGAAAAGMFLAGGLGGGAAGAGSGAAGGSTAAMGAGAAPTAGLSSFTANPAMWSGAVPSGAGFGLGAEVLPAATTLSGGSGLAAGAGLGGTGLGASYGLTSTLGAVGAMPGTSTLSSLTQALGGSGGGAGGLSSYLGPAATALGALAGSQGQQGSQSSTRAMDPRMDGLFYGDLAPRTQGLLGAQMPTAYNAGSQMLSVGSNLLNTPRTPDVFGSQFYKGAADDLAMRTKELLDSNNLAIQGNSVATGGLGGTRQGVAQGVAAGKASDYLQGNLSQLALGQYNQDSNRNLQAITLGSGLMNQGLNTQFQPLQNTASVYQPFTGFGTTTNNVQSGGGWQGALGGALGAAQLGRNAGWW